MDTAEELGQASGSQSAVVYDGFISYSHAADDLLAPRLQAGLQRFAKPWWKRRALRIFRDEASLSANPHLWSSITEALDGSGWFVLLLSPDAASSPWVNREIEHWLSHKDASRIVPVVTDGEFGWTGTDIGPRADSAPPALHGAFSEEPRWVDLRWARSDEQLDLNNARFRNAVADIASAMRGVPKDDLESEEVRQHRRTIRTAWAAGVVVAVLAVLALVAAIFAVGEQNEATRQAEVAQAERDRALAAEEAAVEAGEAEAAARAAEAEQRAAAEAAAGQQRQNLARTLASAAEANLVTDPELSVLLALRAAEATMAAEEPILPEVVDLLHRAIAAPKATHVIPGIRTLGEGMALSLGPDATEVAVIANNGKVLVADTVSGQILREFGPRNDIVTALRFSPADDTLVTASQNGDISLWDSTNGDQTATWPHGPNVTPTSFAFVPSGTAVASGGSDGTIRLWDTETQDLLLEISAHAGAISALDISADGSMIVSASLSDPIARAWDLSTGTAQSVHVQPVSEIGIRDVRFHPGQPWVATVGLAGRQFLWDATNGQELRFYRTDATTTHLSFFPVGIGILSAGSDSLIRFFGTVTAGTAVTVMAGHTAQVDWVESGFSDELAGQVVVSAGRDGTLRIWDGQALFGVESEPFISPGNAYAVDFSPDGSFVAVAADRPFVSSVDSPGGTVAMGYPDGRVATFWESVADGQAHGLAFSPDSSRLAFAGRDGDIVVVDTASHATVLTIADSYPWTNDLAYSPDGLWLAGAGGDATVHVYDSATGSLVTVLAGHGDRLPQSAEVLPEPLPGLGPLNAFTAWRVNGVTFSHDGALIGTAGWDGTARIWDGVSGQQLHVLEGHVAQVSDVAFSPDGDLFASGDHNGEIRLWRPDTGELIRSFQRIPGIIRRIEFSPDGSLLAAAGPGNVTRLWDVASGQVDLALHGPFFDVSDVAFTADGANITTASFDSLARVYVLDIDSLIELAESQVTRDITPEECVRYLGARNCS